MLPYKKYCLISSLVVLLWITNTAFSQGPKLKFKHITSEQGLSNSTIESIFQDHRGFVWFATRDGLNRYDGYQTVVYRYNPKDSSSISDNYIRFIFEDKNHHLWVGTNGGLNRLDMNTNHFTRFKHFSNDPNSISSNIVNCITQDHDGNLWISTYGGGLNKYLPEENRFTHYRHQTDNPKSISSDYVNYIYQDVQHHIWIGTETGLNLFNQRTNSFQLIQSIAEFNTGKINSGINMIKEDGSGNLWLGTQDNGVFIYNYGKNTILSFRHNEKDPSSLASNLVRSILIDTKGKVWIGSVNGGLDLFEPKTKSFYHYQNEPENMFSLSQRTVSSLFEDNQGNMWVGTHRGGVNLYMPDTYKFKLYRQEPDISSISYSDVKAFCEDKAGNIWIGTDGGGLNLFDPVKNTFTYFKYDPFRPGSIGSNEVIDIMEDSESNLWVSTWGGGLNLLDRKTGRFQRYVNDPKNKNSISSDFIQKVFEDRDKNLWIATYYGGLNLFDRKTKKFRRILSDSKGSTHLQGNNIVSINQDRSGNLWFGTDDGGLNCLMAKTGKFIHYFNKQEKIPDLRILFVDSKGRLWVGQMGLYLFNPEKNSFSLYTNKAGLSDEFIEGMTEDRDGNFWIATSNGITRFNPNNLSFKKYNTADGLQGLEFEANAFLKTRDGQMFFGGLNGFNSFYPDDIKTNSYIPPVYITDFQLFNKKVNVGEKNSPLLYDISTTHQIHLNYKQSTFSFGFASLNYTASENNQYAYKLEGWDKDWNYVGKERKASYNNVSPGTYTFYVKGSNNDGLWNEKGTSVEIIIQPPFWLTWWFKLLVLISIISASIWYYRFRRRLELRKIEVQKKEELHQLQLQFFTNISHEFRTPLSLILGPLEKIQKENNKISFEHYYKVIYRNAIRLLRLIDELMDFRKSESGMLNLRVMPGNLSLFIEELYEEFSDLAQQKRIRFTTSVTGNMGEVWFDRQILEKITINLISNSFKYTSDGGTITLEVMDSLEKFKPSFKNELIIKNGHKGKKYLYLRVADTGIGISKESIAHLFERYYKITETHLGSGIGLAFVKSLTSLHKGDILVYSERGKGTEIIIGIPIDKEDYKKEERWLKNEEPGQPRLESIYSKYEHYLPSMEEDNGLSAQKSDRSSQAHILIVDDNEELRSFLRESLKSYHIVEAVNGMDGLIKAKEVFPDLIISDVMMPEMNGIEFCKKIKEDPDTSHIPFLMLTAKDALESRIEGVGSGADFYFSKPLSIELLELTIINILEQRTKLKSKYANQQYAEAKEQAHSIKDKEFMDQLIHVTLANLDDPQMDVDYICIQMGMSRTKLYEKIKSITNQSIGEFVRSIRLQKAAELMTNQDLSLTEVMYSVGIQTQSYFTKAFKKEFGKTPSQFLKDLDRQKPS